MRDTMFDLEEIQNSSLSGLGAMLLDAADDAVRNDDVEDIELAHIEIGKEVLRRVPAPDKVRHLMDFHYKKWADLTAKGVANGIKNHKLNNSYLELRAMMTGFVEVHRSEENDDVN